MRVTSWWLAASALALVLATEPASAGGTAEDYARAAKMPKRVRNKVVHEQIQAMWLDAKTLVYRQQAKDGSSHYLSVDVATGTKRKHDDALALADRVSELLDAASRGWTLRASGARRSKGGGQDTAIVFVNSSKGGVDLYWLDHAGKRKKYGSLAAGARRRQHTFPGHVWLVVGEGGKELGTYTARRKPGVVLIDGEVPEVVPEKEPEEYDPTSERSPDGRWVVSIRRHDVHVRDTNAGVRTKLSTNGSAEDRYRKRWSWSPNGRFLMVVQEQPAQKRTVHVVNSVPEDRFHQAGRLRLPQAGRPDREAAAALLRPRGRPRHRGPGDALRRAVVDRALLVVPRRQPLPLPLQPARAPGAAARRGRAPLRQGARTHRRDQPDVRRLLAEDLPALVCKMANTRCGRASASG